MVAHGRRILSCGSIQLALFLSTLTWSGSSLARPNSDDCGGLSGSARGLCKAAGQTCSIGRFRECYDNGILGDVVTATGVADPPDVNGEADPTIATLFCIGPTSLGAVNAAVGIPSLGRVEVPSHSRNLGP